MKSEIANKLMYIIPIILFHNKILIFVVSGGFTFFENHAVLMAFQA